VTKGLVNLRRHLENIKKFGVPAVVCVNRFPTDTDAELQAIVDGCRAEDVIALVCTHFADGSKGAEALAKAVVAVIDEGKAAYKALYPDDMKLLDKIKTIAKEIYRAGDVVAPKAVADRLAEFEKQGFGHLPICMAKTQYSFSANGDLYGAPSGFELPIREVRLSAGAEFVVAICGDIMTMPGLPRVPSAEAMYVNEAGQIIGLS
jgi:formate--tetrahydrofolate ligase